MASSIVFKVGFQADEAEIKKTVGALTSALQNDISTVLDSGKIKKSLASATIEAGNFQKALERAATSSGQISFSTLNKELIQMGTSVTKVAQTLAAAGPEFNASFKAVAQTLVTADKNIISLSSRLQEMKRVMSQSVKFTLAQTIQRELIGAVRSSITWVKQLDSDLTNIAVVSAKSATEMSKVYDSVLENSKKLKVAASDYAEAALIFYQQGLPDAEVEKRSEITIKAAKAAGVATEEMSTQLTAIWNTYKMAGEEQERAAAVGARLAADTAVEFKDIAEAMQTTASAAAQMGVSYDSLAAIIATVGDVTQQSASIIGNAYKTIFSRFEQLKSSGSDGEVTLNRVSQQLADLGINVLDQAGNLKELDIVIDEVGNNWQNYTAKQQLAIAELVGGTRQYGQFLALMNNFDKYLSLRSKAQGETGSTLTQQYEAALDSIDEKQRLAAESWKRAFKSVFSEDVMKDFYDALIKIGEFVENLLDTFGGLKSIVLTIAAIFSQDIAKSVSGTIAQVRDSAISLFPNGADKITTREIDKVRKTVGEDSEKKAILDVVEQTIPQQNKLNKTIAQGSEAEKQMAMIQKKKLDDLTEEALKHSEIVAQMQKEVKLAKEQAENEFLEKKKPLESAKNQKIMERDTLLKDMERDPDKEYIDLLNELDKTNEKMEQTTNSRDYEDALDKHRKVEEKIGRTKHDKGQEVFDRANTKREKNQKQLEDYNKAIEELEQKLQAVAKAEGKIKDPFVKMKSKVLDEMNEALKGNEVNIEKNSEAYQELQGTYLDLVKALSDGDEVKEKTLKGIDSSSISNYSQLLEALQERMTEYNETEIGQQNPFPESDLAQLDEASRGYQRLGENVRGLQGDQDDFKFSVEELTGAIAGAAAASVAFGTAIGNFVKKMSDGEVTFGDAVAVIGSLIPLITSLIALSTALGISYNENTKKIEIKALTNLKAAVTEGALAAAAKKAWDAMLGPVGLGIAAITTLITLLTALVAIWAKARKEMTAEYQLEQANEQLEKMAQAEEKAKEKADALRESFNKYQSAQEQLSNCVKGTKEWQEALVETNEAALELLGNLPSDVNVKDWFVTDRQTGARILNKDAYDKLQRDFDEEASRASYLTAIQKTKVKGLEIDKQAEDLASNSGLGFAKTQVLKDEYKSGLNYNSWDEFSKSINSYVKRGLENSLLTDKDKEYFVDQFKDLADAAMGVKDTFEEINRMTIEEKFGDQYTREQKDFVAQVMTQDSYKNVIYEELLEKYGKISENDESDLKQLLKYYNEATGSDATLAKNAVRPQNGFRTQKEIAFQDGERTIKLSLEDILKEITDVVQQDTMEKSFKSIIDNSQQLANAGEIANALFKVISGEENSFGDYQSIKNSLDQWNNTSHDPEETAAIKAVFGTMQGAYDFILSQVEDIMNMASGQSLSVKGRYQDFLQNYSNSLGEEDASDIVGYMSSAFKNNGSQGLNIISQIFEQAGEKEGGLKSLLDTMYSIDWKNPDIDDLAIQLDNLDFKDPADTALSLANALKIYTEANLEAANATYASLSKIAEGLDQYSILEQEDIKKLAEAGVAVDAYFQKMADGTYMLTKDASEFAREVQQIGMKGLYDVIDQSSRRSLEILNAQEMETQTMGSRENLKARIDLVEAVNGKTEEGQQLKATYEKMLSIGGSWEAFAEKVTEFYETSGVTNEKISAMLEEYATESVEAEKAIEEANFQNDVKTFGFDLEETQDYADRLQEVNKELKLTEKQARDMAIANQRLDRGLTNLNKGLEGYKTSLKEANKKTFEYSQAMEGLKDDLADIFNIGDGDMLSDSFAIATLESDLLAAALDGDVEALTNLRNEAAIDLGEGLIQPLQDSIENFDELNNRLANSDSAFVTYFSELDEASQKAWLATSAWATLKNGIETGIEKMPIDEFEASMNQLIENAGFTYEQVTSLLGSMGVSAKVNTDYVKETTIVPTYQEHRKIIGYDQVPIVSPLGYVLGGTQSVPIYETYVVDGPGKEVDGWKPTYSVEVESGDTTSGGKLTIGNSGAYSPPKPSYSSTASGSAGGGGGGSKTAEPKKVDKVSYHKRYNNIEQQIDETSRSMERYDEAVNDSSGARRLANLNKEIQLLVKQGNNYKKLTEEAKKYYQADKQAVLEGLKKSGYDTNNVIFNSDGTIANIEEIQKYWENYVNRYIGADGIVPEAQQEMYEADKEFAEEQIENLNQLTETALKFQESFDNATQTIRDMISKKVEEVQYEVDLKIGIYDRDLQKLSTMIDLFGELGVKIGKTIDLQKERVADIILEGKTYMDAADDIAEKIEHLQPTDENRGWFVEQFGEEAWEKYITGNGGIPEEAISAVQEYADSLLDNISDLNSELKDIFSTYAEQFQLLLKDFDDINADLEKNQRILEIYQKLYDLSEDKSTERKIGELGIASAARSTSGAALQTAIAERDTWQAEYDKREKALNDFTESLKEKDISAYTAAEATVYNSYKSLLDEAKQGLQDAEAEIYNNLDDFLDKIEEETQRKFAVARANFMEEISDGKFNDIEYADLLYNDDKELKSLFLDDYDKEYNLDKLTYQVNKHLKDSNITDPTRLKAYEDFLKNINDYRAEGIKLTQDQIDKMQKEFELQQLYDEYEEAKNQKNTMRLARDASGNYSYIYSADSNTESLDDITQKIADKRKEIRDFGKEISESMQEAYWQTTQELESHLAETGGIIDEHAENLMKKLDFYAGKIQEASTDTGIAFKDTSLGIIFHDDNMVAAHATNTAAFEALEQREQKATEEKQAMIANACDLIGIDYTELNTEVEEKTVAMMYQNAALAGSAESAKTRINDAMTSSMNTLTVTSESICLSLQAMITKYDELIDKINTWNGIEVKDKKATFTANYKTVFETEGEPYDPGLDPNINNYTPEDESDNDANEEQPAVIAVTAEEPEPESIITTTKEPDSKPKSEPQKLSENAERVYSYIEAHIGPDGVMPEGWTTDSALGRFSSRAIEEAVWYYKQVHLGAKIPAVYTGGLFEQPSVTSIAEKGPELVLNAEDTKNILAAVSAIRNSVFARSFSLRTEALQGIHSPIATPQESIVPVAQDVQISATFPNVSVAEEIEEALNNLVNEAVQYAARKK